MSEQLRHLAGNIRRRNGDLTEAAICERGAENIEVLRKALLVAAGRLAWCGKAEIGVGHVEGRRLADGWSEEAHEVLGATIS